jgi:hypothetical protein
LVFLVPYRQYKSYVSIEIRRHSLHGTILNSYEKQAAADRPSLPLSHPRALEGPAYYCRLKTSRSLSKRSTNEPTFPRRPYIGFSRPLRTVAISPSPKRSLPAGYQAAEGALWVRWRILGNALFGAVRETLTTAAASAGVDLPVRDNQYDAATALRNAEEFVCQRVDLVVESDRSTNCAGNCQQNQRRRNSADRCWISRIPMPRSWEWANIAWAMKRECFWHSLQRATGVARMSWAVGLDIKEAGLSFTAASPAPSQAFARKSRIV